MHPRKELRKKVVELLSTPDGDGVYPTAAQGRVHPSRVFHHRKGELPVICVYTLQESVSPESQQTAPRELARDVSLVIEAWVKVEPTTPGQQPLADDALDDIAEQIEAVMHADPYLAGTAGDSILVDTDTEMVEGGGEMMGLLVMTYAVTYRTYAPDTSGVVRDDFLTVSAEHNQGGTQDTDDAAHDDFTVQEVTP